MPGISARSGLSTPTTTSKVTTFCTVCGDWRTWVTCLETCAGKSVDGEGGLVTFLDAADVAFADIGVDLHLGEIGGDQKQRRRLKAGRDGLTLRHIARHDGAVDRRNDVGIVEIDLRRIELGLALIDRRLVEVDLGLRPDRRRSSR